MKILEEDKKNQLIRVVPENIDDLWVLYNIIRLDDQIYARTTREIKVQQEMSRPTEGKRISMNLGIRVEKIYFQDDVLRVNGVIIAAPEEFALIGSHHSISIVLGKPITIHKNEWLSYDLKRIEQASQDSGHPILIVALDDEKGCIALLRQHGIDVKTEIDAKLPGKIEAEKRDTALTKYFNTILNSLAQIWNMNHSLIAIIGPGFWKEIFAKYIRENNPTLFKEVSAIRNVGNGGIAGVEEAVRSGVLDVVAKKIRVIEETRAIEEILSRLGSQSMNVSYGLENVKNAINHGAVELLLVADNFLREANDEKRRQMECSMKNAEKMRGRIMIVSTEHEAGKQLLNLGGIAALLRYSIY